jgi:pimeloyl-ACP methyl ester carboxylesterase
MIQNVVIIHGFADISGMWRRLVEPLTSARFNPFLFRYPTFRNTIDVPAIADMLCDFVRGHFGKDEFQMIGHSQGGLIAEWADFFMKPHGLKRIVTIATPFHGNSLPLFVPRSAIDHWPFSRKQLKGLMCWSPVIRRLVAARYRQSTTTEYFSFVGFSGRIWKVESDGVVAVCEATRDALWYDIQGGIPTPRAVPSSTRTIILKRNHLPLGWVRSKSNFPQLLIDALQGKDVVQPSMPAFRQFALIVPARVEHEWQWPSNAHRIVSRATYDPEYRVVYGEAREACVDLHWNGLKFETRPGMMTYVLANSGFSPSFPAGDRR